MISEDSCAEAVGPVAQKELLEKRSSAPTAFAKTRRHSLSSYKGVQDHSREAMAHELCDRAGQATGYVGLTPFRTASATNVSEARQASSWKRNCRPSAARDTRQVRGNQGRTKGLCASRTAIGLLSSYSGRGKLPVGTCRKTEYSLNKEHAESLPGSRIMRDHDP